MHYQLAGLRTHTGNYELARRIPWCVSAIALTLMCSATGVQAQSAAPGTVVELEAITIQGADQVPGTTVVGTATDGLSGLDPLTEARIKLDALPGGTAVIAPEDVKGRANVTISDTLAMVPGVIVQDFFGGNDQPRIQIRAAAQQNPLERGVLVLQDGLPINRADGSYVVGFADPRSSFFTEIYRGYAANRLGATVLGGAINFVSHNGLTSPGGEGLVELGSFGQKSVFARAGGRSGNLDGHAALSFTDRDGFREHNTSERFNLNINAGARVNENVTTRLFFGYTNLGFDVAGPLSKRLLAEDPKQICTGPPNCLGPNVVRDQPRRDADQLRVGSRTSARFGDHLFNLGLGYTYTDDSFRFPIPGGVRDTEGGDFTAVTRYAYAPDKSQPLPLFEFTGQYAVGSADRAYFTNNRGEKGQLFGDNEFDATTLSLYAGLHVPLLSRFVVSPAISYSYATRENEDLYGLVPRPILAFTPAGPINPTPPQTIQDTSYDRSYSEWTPSLGLSYEFMRSNTAFAAVSRSFEPPTHDDLIATINGNPNASPGFDKNGSQPPNPNFGPAFSTPDLEAQTATTVEGGFKGQSDNWAYSATAYYSWVEDELLSLRDESGVPLGAVNADRTNHFGVELGLAGELARNVSGRVAYTYQDFRFDDDVRFGDNQLAGVVTHNINAALRYNFTPGLFVETEVNWRPDETPVDNANTLFNDSFVVVDVRGNYDVTENFSLYGEVRNVFDEVYASSTLIADTAASQEQAAFLPGDGRAFIVGARGQF